MLSPVENHENLAAIMKRRERTARKAASVTLTGRSSGRGVGARENSARRRKGGEDEEQEGEDGSDTSEHVY